MKKILIYNSGGGLGDSIQLFSLILNLCVFFNTYYPSNAIQIHMKLELIEIHS